MPQIITNRCGFDSANKGFTIIEAIISLVILSIVMTAGIKIYMVAGQITGLSTHKKLALENASSKLEEIRDTLAGLKQDSSYNLTVFDTQFPEGVHHDDILLGKLAADRDILYTNVGSGPDYKEVDVTITWTEPDANNPRHITLKTIITP